MASGKCVFGHMASGRSFKPRTCITERMPNKHSSANLVCLLNRFVKNCPAFSYGKCEQTNRLTVIGAKQTSSDVLSVTDIRGNTTNANEGIRHCSFAFAVLSTYTHFKLTNASVCHSFGICVRGFRVKKFRPKSLGKSFWAGGFGRMCGNAFDHVWHAASVFKLQQLLPRNICDLLSNYFHDRVFFVVYGTPVSTTRPISAGVPQGSVFGPLLYAVCTGDFPLPNDITMLAAFVDDMSKTSFQFLWHVL